MILDTVGPIYQATGSGGLLIFLALIIVGAVAYVAFAAILGRADIGRLVESVRRTNA